MEVDLSMFKFVLALALMFFLSATPLSLAASAPVDSAKVKQVVGSQYNDFVKDLETLEASTREQGTRKAAPK